MGIVTVNGISYVGNNVTIIGDAVFIDGQPKSNEKILTIDIDGHVENFTCDKNVTLKGSCEVTNVKAGGNVQCDNVLGDISACGSVQCDNVGGNIITSGSVECNEVGGNITANGSVVCS